MLRWNKMNVLSVLKTEKKQNNKQQLFESNHFILIHIETFVCLQIFHEFFELLIEIFRKSNWTMSSSDKNRFDAIIPAIDWNNHEKGKTVADVVTERYFKFINTQLCQKNWRDLLPKTREIHLKKAVFVYVIFSLKRQSFLSTKSASRSR